MKKNFKWFILSGVLFFYAFLYIATSKDFPCEGDCAKFENIREKLSKDSAVFSSFPCNTDILCVYVKDSLQHNWSGLADTACIYLNNEGLQNYKVNIIGNSARDTLLTRTCP